MSEQILEALRAHFPVETIPGNAHTSAMIALGVPDTVAAALAVPGGSPPQELHVTLAFYPAPLGDPEKWAQLGQVLRGLAAAMPAPVCLLAGSGRFLGVSEGKDACILNVDAPGINELRQAAVNVSGQLGLPHSTLHSFTPHLTLSYAGPDAPHPMPRPQVPPFAFSGLELWVAGSKVVFPFAPVGVNLYRPAAVLAKADDAALDDRSAAQSLYAQLTGDLLAVTHSDRHIRRLTDHLNAHHTRAFEGLTAAIPAVRGSALEASALHHAAEAAGARRAGA